MRAISTASCGSMPSPPTQSLAEIRTEMGLPRPCGTNRVEDLQRIAHPGLNEPPYSSARRLVSGVMKDDRR
jgi:hypothetical protein